MTTASTASLSLSEMDPLTAQRITLVHPKLSSAVTQLDQQLRAQGILIRCVQGLRTWAQQAAIYAEGRTAPGKIVTNAAPGHSYHEFGIAVDLIPGLREEAQWEPNWDHESDDFQAMIRAGVALGLINGSVWVSIKDYPHFQLPGVPVSPTQEMRDFLLKYGIKGFWGQYIDSPSPSSASASQSASSASGSASHTF